MSLLFMDGMDNLSTAGDGTEALEEKWNSAVDAIGTSGVTWEASAGRFGGGAAKISSGTGTSFLEKVIPTRSTVIVAFALKLGSNFEGKVLVFGIQGHEQIYMYIESDLTVEFRTDQDNELVSSSPDGFAFNEQNWFFIEVKVKVDSVNGSIEMRVNEEEWINATGIKTDTQGTGDYGDVGFYESFSSVYWIDDVIILDDQGSRLNDFLGDIRISTLLPSADTARADFASKSGGPNFEEVDDPERDEDTTHNESQTVGDRDMFEFDNLSETPDEIFALQASISARKTEAGSRGLAAVVDEGGSVHVAPGHLLNQEYLYEMFIWELNPATGAPWTESEINGLKAGYEISS